MAEHDPALVEKAAEALSGEAWVHGAFPWQKLREDERDGYRRYARAVLDAVAPAIWDTALLRAAERLPALTEGTDRHGTQTWREHGRDVYSLAIEEAQGAIRNMAAQQREEQD